MNTNKKGGVVISPNLKKESVVLTEEGSLIKVDNVQQRKQVIKSLLKRK